MFGSQIPSWVSKSKQDVISNKQWPQKARQFHGPMDQPFLSSKKKALVDIIDMQGFLVALQAQEPNLLPLLWGRGWLAEFLF